MFIVERWICSELKSAENSVRSARSVRDVSIALTLWGKVVLDGNSRLLDVTLGGGDSSTGAAAAAPPCPTVPSSASSSLSGSSSHVVPSGRLLPSPLSLASAAPATASRSTQVLSLVLPQLAADRRMADVITLTDPDMVVYVFSDSDSDEDPNDYQVTMCDDTDAERESNGILAMSSHTNAITKFTQQVQSSAAPVVTIAVPASATLQVTTPVDHTAADTVAAPGGVAATSTTAAVLVPSQVGHRERTTGVTTGVTNA